MYIAFTPAIVLAAVLIASGIAKIRTPDDAAGWAEMGVPAVLRQPWLIRLHPIGELVLAAALLFLGGVLGLLAAIAAAVLFAAYLVMVWRAYRRTPDAACACFGERKPITTRTILRNVWLLLLALVLVGSLWGTPPWGGVSVAVVEALRSPVWSFLLLQGVVIAISVYVLFPGTAESTPAAALSPATDSANPADELDDYISVRIPAVPVTAGDGTVVNLRRLAALQPRLLLAVSETCGSCLPVIEKADEWQALLPEVGVHLLITAKPESSKLTRDEHPHSLHDPHQYVRDSISEWATPSAILLGADGMVAGGPVTGTSAVYSFVGDIYESLHGTRPPA